MTYDPTPTPQSDDGVFSYVAGSSGGYTFAEVGDNNVNSILHGANSSAVRGDRFNEIRYPPAVCGGAAISPGPTRRSGRRY